jgi:23S rRNA (pseudouridine1915-N3)-methyltransferase
MNIDVFMSSPGEKIKIPNYYREALAEYKKRLAPYTKLNLITGIKTVPVKKNGTRYIQISSDGVNLTSQALAEKFISLTVGGVSGFAFFFGSCGQTPPGYFDYRLSLVSPDISAALQAVLLYEQIYRVMKIANNEPYHK